MESLPLSAESQTAGEGPPLTLTEEEEAALLAEYGTAGVYDETLSLPDNSNFHSEISGPHVFLTGAPIEEEESQEEVVLSQVGDMRSLCQMSLAHLLIMHTNVFDSVTSSHLMAATSDAMNQMEEKGIRRRVSSAGTPKPDDTSALLEKANALLEESKAVLTRVHFDPQNDAEFQKQLRCVKLSERAMGIDEVDDFLDKEDLLESDDGEELLTQSEKARAQVTTKVRQVTSNEKDDVPNPHEDDAGTDGDTAVPPRPLTLKEELIAMVPESLFSFEFEPCKEDMKLDVNWDEIEKRADAAVVTLEEHPATESSIVAMADEARKRITTLFAPLSTYAEREGSSAAETPQQLDFFFAPSAEQALANRDKREEEATEVDIRSLIAAQDAAVSNKTKGQEARGQQALKPFQEVMDTLLPSAIEVSPAEVEAAAVSEEQPEATAASTEDAEKASSNLMLLLMKAEEREFKRMRDEDLRMQRIVEEIAEAVEAIQVLILQCFGEETIARSAVGSAEAAQRPLLENRCMDDRALTEKAIRLRQFQTSVAKAQQNEAEYLKIYETIQSEEEVEYQALLSSHKQQLTAVASAVAKRQKREKDDAVCRFNDLKMQFTNEASRLRSQMLTSLTPSNERSAPIFTSERLDVLSSSHTQVRQFCFTSEKQLNAFGSSKAVHTDLSKVKSAFSKAPSSDQASSDSGRNCLNAECLEKLMPLTFSAISNYPKEAPQHFYSIALPLENLATLDYASLMTVAVPHQHAGTVTVGDFVRELDLSNNRLEALHMIDLLRVFPLLRKAQFANNRISEVGDYKQSARPSSMRGVTAAYENALAESVLLESLDISNNALLDLGVIGKLISSSLKVLSAFGNSIHSVTPLMTCTKLEELNLSRNKIQDLKPLSSLCMLMTLDVSDNEVSDIHCLAGNTRFLEKLFLSRNPIHSLPSNNCVWLFVHQLFINECQVDSLALGSIPWMPNLQILHANSNRIQCISGLRHCTRLTDLQLGHNQISSIEDLLPLTQCTQLASVDIRVNPISGRDDTSQENTDSEQRLSTTLLPPSVEAALLRMLPSIREINNCLVPSRECQAFLTSKPPSGSMHQLFWQANEVLVELSRSSSSYLENTEVLNWDCFEATTRERLEVLEIRGRQRYRAAVALEAKMREDALKANREYVPLVHRLSERVKDQYQQRRMTSIQQYLKELLQQFHQGTPYNNAHVINPSYAQRCSKYKEQQAKEIIVEWIYGQTLVRKARKELTELREVYSKSVEFKQREAARVIQRFGRGAIMRGRLRRIMRDDLMDNAEDDILASLDMNVGEPAITGDFLSIMGNVLQKVTPIGGERFAVPDTSLLPKPSHLASIRAGSAPDGVANTLRVDSQGVSSDGRPSSLNGRGDAPPKASLEDQWGATVAQQIRKKDEKRNREMLRAKRDGYMKDPLNARKQTSGR